MLVLIYYFIGATLSKKCQSEGLIKVKKERFAIERGFFKEGQIKSARSAFTRKLGNGRTLMFTFTLFSTSFFNFV